MEKNTPKLNEIGRKHGMTVPENYFADFSEKMAGQLPHREIPLAEPVTLWMRVRPWIYMAAMFAGIWLMMKMFTTISSVEPGQSGDAGMVATVAEERTIEEEFIDFYVDDYVVYDMLFADNEY